MTDEEFKSVIESFTAERRETERHIEELREEIADLRKQIEKLSKPSYGAIRTSWKTDDDDMYGDMYDYMYDDFYKDMYEMHHKEKKFFRNVFAYNKTFAGIKYNDIILNMARKDFEVDVKFDIILENENSLAIIEIEIEDQIDPGFVKKLAEEKINLFRKYFSEYKDHNIYLGIAGRPFEDAVLEEAKRYGVGVIRQVGEGIEVDTTGLKVY